MSRLGLFGGTFDPPHIGHLVIAEQARIELGLDRVVFVPAGVPPHKRARAVAPAAHRLAMTRLAVRGNRGFSVSPLEVRRGGASYTIETLRDVAAAHPGARLFLVIGEDGLRDFATWREPEAILALATLAVAPRPLDREAPAPERRWERHVRRLAAPRLEISSSAIRARLGRRRSVRYLVPDRVAAYIERHRLYGSGR